MLLASDHHRRFRLASGACAVVVLLAADYRMAIFVAGGLAIVIATHPRTLSRSAALLAVGALILPWVFFGARTFTTDVVAAISQVSPSERASAGLDDFNGRAYIWEVTITRQARLSTARQLVGYGPAGHYVSGVSQGYANRLSSAFTKPLQAGSHNTALQHLLDGGWIGLGLLLGATWVTARRLARAHDPYLLAALGMVVASAVAGATEATLAPGIHPPGFAVLVCCAAIATRSGDPANPHRDERDVVRAGN
jgi:hypothetical protein